MEYGYPIRYPIPVREFCEVSAYHAISHKQVKDAGSMRSSQKVSLSLDCKIIVVESHIRAVLATDLKCCLAVAAQRSRQAVFGTAPSAAALALRYSNWHCTTL